MVGSGAEFACRQLRCVPQAAGTASLCASRGLRGCLTKHGRPQSRREQGRPWVAALARGPYDALPPGERLAALSDLVQLVLDAPSVRAALEARHEEGARMRRRKWDDNRVRPARPAPGSPNQPPGPHRRGALSRVMRGRRALGRVVKRAAALPAQALNPMLLPASAPMDLRRRSNAPRVARRWRSARGRRRRRSARARPPTRRPRSCSASARLSARAWLRSRPARRGPTRLPAPTAAAPRPRRAAGRTARPTPSATRRR